MNKFNRLLKTLLIVLVIALIFAILRPIPAKAYYGTATPDMPHIKGILFRTGGAVANVTLNEIAYIITDGEVLEEEWQVEDIRRKSILFRKKSDKKFVEIYLNHPKMLRQTTDTSFLGTDLNLFDALEMVGKSFGVNVIMQNHYMEKVSPSMQPRTLQALLKQLVKPPFYVIESHPFYHVVTDKKRYQSLGNQDYFHSTYNRSKLENFYPSLQNYGTLISRGEDVRETLSRLAIATGIPIMVSEKLYFPVFAVFHNVKFSVILEKLLYTNDCYLIEYEKGIEVVR